MKCASCGRVNGEDAAFCAGCGSPLGQPVACDACGRVAGPDEAFCTGCGARLTTATPPPAAERAPTPDVEPPDGERRHLTVMFVDLCGSTQLSEQLDPEDMRDLVLAYQAACAAAITEHAGYIARYTGDGILAYFGFPQAHEDDARLAVAAGLGIMEAIASMRAWFGRDDINVRVGVHTGEVVVADMGAGNRRQERDIVGDTPNVAARLQSAATPGSIVISDRTRALIEGWFTFTELGELSLAGVSRPVPAFRVDAATEARTRLDAVAGRGLTPLVGRGKEMAALLEQWSDVVGGEGRVVLLSGEPGIGKSRLAHELHRRAKSTGARAIRLRCSPYHQNSVLFPVVEHLQRVVDGAAEAPEKRLDRLEAELREAGLVVDRTAPLLAELLALPGSGRYVPSADSPDRRKRRTLNALFAWLVAQGRESPLLLTVEDVHWIDPTTQELFGRFFGPEPVGDVMFVATHRSEHALAWLDRPHVRRMALERLDGEHVRQIVGSITGGKELPAGLEKQIADRTDGVPLFVEEVTQAVLESGAVTEKDGRYVATADLPDRLVPSTLRESLVARLDGLGSAREVAQVLSVIGREVSADFVQTVSMLDDDELEAGLDRLVDSDLVRRREASTGARYSLKHWLVQDVAYESLLRSARRRYHERIAAALPREWRDITETQPEFVAHHLIAAGKEVDAIAYLHRAGELAHRRSACDEAVEHMTRALDLLRRQPETPERLQLELQLLIGVGAPLTASKGYSVPEVEATYTRAGQICRTLGGETPQFFRALYGTWRVHLLRADYDRAMGFGHQLMQLAERSGNETQLAAARRALGSTLVYLGRDQAEARSYLDAVIHSTELEKTRTTFIDELHDVTDPWITCHGYASWSLWLIGEADSARAMSDRTIELARELNHPFTKALSLAFGSWLCQFTGDAEGCRTRAAESLAIATDQGFAFWVGWNEIMLGWVDATAGNVDRGIVTMERGLENWRAVGSELGTPYFLTLMGTTHRDAGRLDEAHEALTAADAVGARTHEGWWEPEVVRLRGELLGRRGGAPDAVEHELRAALAMAGDRGARSLGLRAAVSLAQHLRDNGQPAAARDLLAAEIGRFDQAAGETSEARALLLDGFA